MLAEKVTAGYFDLGGTIRSQSTTKTIEQLQPILKKIGITRVANITGLDTIGIPVAVCIRPNSKHLSVSQGKGLSWELAYTSAVMESIEGYHAENLAKPCFRDSFSKLSNTNYFVNPQLFNTGFFRSDNLKDQLMDWIEGINLIDKTRVFLPHSLVCLDSTTPHPEYAFLSTSSNGLAAGNTLDEAICHGIYEIIERDSLYRWSILSDQDRAATQLKLETIHSPINQNVLTQYKRENIWVKIWDITSILDVPSFHCVIRDPNVFRNVSMFRGTGTHLSKEIALSRALTEAAQSRLTVISGSRDDVFADHYQKRYVFKYSLHDYEGSKHYKDCYQPDFNSSFSENIFLLISCLEKQNFSQIYYINHTKPELDIPVVHVFIPGLQFNGTRI